MKWFLYNVLFAIAYCVALPSFILRMKRRGGYRARMGDRFARYPADSRGIWVGRLPELAENGEPQTAVASLYEWVNPHPQKVIASLRLKKDTPIIDYSLFALTLRDRIE